MAANTSGRLVFGTRKYAALHLLLARWLRFFSGVGKQYCYVTLGGTELRDIHSLVFVDPALVTAVWSYEDVADRCKLARETALTLAAHDVIVDVQNSTVWNHKRVSELPHIFFLDFVGPCAWGDLAARFADLFQRETIREGDCLLITSQTVARYRGPEGIREYFSGELSILGVDETDDAIIKALFRRAHPTMTLFKALSLNGIQSELALRCFGAVKYRDTFPMGIYGYTVESGKTDLATFVRDGATRYFDGSSGNMCDPDHF
jgi:hypothetical protein